MKSKTAIAKALRRIPYEKVADAINGGHLNGALRSIPKIVFRQLDPGQRGVASCEVHETGIETLQEIRVEFCPVLESTVSGCKIVLDLERIAEELIRYNGRLSVTAILTHELIHAIQFQNGYARSHNKVFEECCLFACHSGLRVVGGKGRYRPVFEEKYPIVPAILRRSPARKRRRAGRSFSTLRKSH